MYGTKYDAEKKLWTGPDIPSTFNPQISVGQVIQKFMKVHGSQLAQICDDTGDRMSYDDMWKKTVRAAQNIQKLGYIRTDVFGYSGINYNLAPVVYAAFCLGCPITTISPSFGKGDLNHILKITKPKLMFCNVENYALVSECLKENGNDAKIFTFGGTVGNSDPVESLFVETGMESTFIPVRVNGEKDVAAILCSSGTTGLAKGVSLSHASIIEKCGDLCHINSGDIHYCPGSLYWISGLFMFILSAINGATSIVTKKKFSADLMLRLIEQYRISFLMSSPYHLVMILKSENIRSADLSSLKCYFVGGNRIPVAAPSEINKFLPNGKMYSGYGLTEVALVLSATFSKFDERDTVGQLVHGSNVKIIDDKGTRCGIGIDGEICVKCRHQFLGYYGNEEATSKAIDSEGFILTGDVGHFDEDGYLYIVDRIKDVFKYYNSKIYPSEIESQLIELADIESVCVVSIPDSSVGDLPAAAVVRKTNSSITEQDICAMVADNFDDYKQLRGGVYFMDSFPSTLSGKVLRREIKKIVVKHYTNPNYRRK